MRRITDAIQIYDQSRTDLTVSTTAGQTVALNDGIYDIWSDVDVFIKTHPTANDVTIGSGYLLRANNTIPILIRYGDKLGAITATGTGTISIYKVG